jgi:hypothetical protein
MFAMPLVVTFVRVNTISTYKPAKSDWMIADTGDSK